MKIFAAALAFPLVMAWPTIGETAAKKAKAYAKSPPAFVGQLSRPSFYYGDPSRRPRSRNPAWDVYGTDGEYRGSDPDPLIREMLHRDDPKARCCG